MKKITSPKCALLLVAFLLLNQFSIGQILSEDLTLSTQQDVEDFNYTQIDGKLTISGADINDLSPLLILTSVTDLIIGANEMLSSLEGLQNITSIGGDIVIQENAILANLDQLSGLTVIPGDLIINGNSILANLGGLQNITSVGTDLYVENNLILTDLNGLSNIESVGHDIVINDNEGLIDLDGLLKITACHGDLIIARNDILPNVGGLQNISVVEDNLIIEYNDKIMNLDGLLSINSIGGYIDISSNKDLSSLIGLQNITIVEGRLEIYNNDALINLSGLQNITSVGGIFRIRGNDGITNLEELQSVTMVGEYLEIDNNDLLENLDGLANLTSIVENLLITSNTNLTSFCGLFTLLNGGGLIGEYTVEDNFYNPTQQQIINNGTCEEEASNVKTIFAMPSSSECGIWNVPVQIKNFSGVGAISLKLSYNETSLIYNGVDLNPAITSAVINGATSGKFSLLYFGDEVTLDDNDVLFTLQFSVDPSISGTSFNLNWSREPGDCELAGQDGETVFGSSFIDLEVNVFTDELPEIACVEDIEVENDAGVCGAVVNYITPVGTDNCPNPVTVRTVGLASGELFPVGITTNTFVVTDSKGNTAECSFTVTVTDTESPVITGCPEDILVNTETRESCDQLVSWILPTANDNCEIESLVSDYESGVTFPVGTTTVTYTATDNAMSANVQTCSFNVTVIDDTPPEIIAPDDIEVNNDLGECGAVVTFATPSGTDNCAGATTEQILGLGSGEIFPVGTTTNTFVVTDLAGNTAECSFDVIVNDSEAPLINCLENITAYTEDRTSCDQVVNWIPPSATDNCSLISCIGDYEPGATFPVGTTTVTYTATDNAIPANISYCSFEITIIDNTSPVITTCALSQSAIVTDGCSVKMPDFVSTSEATDNCEVVTITQQPAVGTWMDYDENPYDVTIIATDASGNTSSCDSYFTVNKATISGTMVYNNADQTPLGNITVQLLDSNGLTVVDEDITSVEENLTGTYSFTDLCAGSYTIRIVNNNKDVGYINATDAAAVNKWGTAYGNIEYIRFLAADVAGDEPNLPNWYINSQDALRIQNYFVFDTAFDRSPWSYWSAGMQINSNTNPYSSAAEHPVSIAVEVGGADAVTNIYAMATGDFNGSFIPNRLKSARENLSLKSASTISMVESCEFELPFQVESDMEVGAISMILTFPKQLVEVLDVKINGSEVPVSWALKGEELRIGWNSLNPVSVASNENLLTLKLKTTDKFSIGKSFYFKLKNSPLNELADGNLDVIQGATLVTAKVGNEMTRQNEDEEMNDFSMYNYPNPFDNTTTIKYSLPGDGKVSIRLYNQLGQLVDILLDENKEAGQYFIKDYGNALQPGIYFAQLSLTSPQVNYIRTIKLNVIK